MKRCRHERRSRTWNTVTFADGSTLRVGTICGDCRHWFVICESNDAPEAVGIEISAARLIAGYYTGNDTDDTLADPLCVEVMEHWIGLPDAPMSESAAQVSHLALTATADDWANEESP